MKYWMLAVICGGVMMMAMAQRAEAHCQVPCGIYDDHARVHAMMEDVTTITKAIRKIRALSKKADAKSRNQLVRWVVTKEAHASKIIKVIAEYFLTQKIKPAKAGDAKAYKAYLTKLARHHAVMRAAMKTKQTVSLKAAEGLKAAITAISGYWPAKK